MKKDDKTQSPWIQLSNSKMALPLGFWCETIKVLLCKLFVVVFSIICCWQYHKNMLSIWSQSQGSDISTRIWVWCPDGHSLATSQIQVFLPQTIVCCCSPSAALNKNTEIIGEEQHVDPECWDLWEGELEMDISCPLLGVVMWPILVKETLREESQFMQKSHTRKMLTALQPTRVPPLNPVL